MNGQIETAIQCPSDAFYHDIYKQVTNPCHICLRKLQEPSL